MLGQWTCKAQVSKGEVVVVVFENADWTPGVDSRFAVEAWTPEDRYCFSPSEVRLFDHFSNARKYTKEVFGIDFVEEDEEYKLQSAASEYELGVEFWTKADGFNRYLFRKLTDGEPVGLVLETAKFGPYEWLRKYGPTAYQAAPLHPEDDRGW